MKIFWEKLMRVSIVVIMIVAVFVLILRSSFPVFECVSSSKELIEIEKPTTGQESSRFLWNYRSMDLITQAFVLFAAAACCVAILRGKEKPE